MGVFASLCGLLGNRRDSRPGGSLVTNDLWPSKKDTVQSGCARSAWRSDSTFQSVHCLEDLPPLAEARRSPLRGRMFAFFRPSEDNNKNHVLDWPVRHSSVERDFEDNLEQIQKTELALEAREDKIRELELERESIAHRIAVLKADGSSLCVS